MRWPMHGSAVQCSAGTATHGSATCHPSHAAAGYSGVAFDQADLGVEMGGMPLMAKGQPLNFDAAAASKYLKVGPELCACTHCATSKLVPAVLPETVAVTARIIFSFFLFSRWVRGGRRAPWGERGRGRGARPAGGQTLGERASNLLARAYAYTLLARAHPYLRLAGAATSGACLPHTLPPLSTPTLPTHPPTIPCAGHMRHARDRGRQGHRRHGVGQRVCLGVSGWSRFLPAATHSCTHCNCTRGLIHRVLVSKAPQGLLRANAASSELHSYLQKNGVVYERLTGANLLPLRRCDLSYDYVKINAEYTT